MKPPEFFERGVEFADDDFGSDVRERVDLEEGMMLIETRRPVVDFADVWGEREEVFGNEEVRLQK